MAGSKKTTQQAQSASQPTHEQIEKKAFELWDAAGRPIGDGKEFWIEAEKQLKQ